MILKQCDSKQETLNTLKQLLKDSNNDKQRSLISRDLNLLKSGIESEQENAYYIDFYLKKSQNIIVLHDIRIEHKGRTAQIDHILISRLGIELLESKSFKGKLTIKEDASLEVLDNNKTLSYPNPLEQSKRHADVLREFIKDNFHFAKRVDLLGGFNIKSVVLINPKTPVTNQTLPNQFFRADAYISKRSEELDRISFIKTLQLISTMVNIETVKELANLIKDTHTPINFDYKNKYKISNLSNKVQDISNNEEMLTEGSPCPFCQKKLVIRNGNNNTTFLGCSGFPKCRFNRSIKQI